MVNSPVGEREPVVGAIGMRQRLEYALMALSVIAGVTANFFVTIGGPTLRSHFMEHRRRELLWTNDGGQSHSHNSQSLSAPSKRS
jgi:hypothetical protein